MASLLSSLHEWFWPPHIRKRGGVQKSMGNKVPWKTGMLIYLPVTSRPLISPQKEAVLSPCNFATTHLTACILNFYLPSTSRPMKRRTISQCPIIGCTYFKHIRWGGGGVEANTVQSTPKIDPRALCPFFYRGDKEKRGRKEVALLAPIHSVSKRFSALLSQTLKTITSLKKRESRIPLSTCPK